MCAVLLAGAIYSARKPGQLLVAAPNDLTQSCFVASIVALLLVLLYEYDGRIDSARILRPIRWCGTMCYSLYFVHWPVVKVVSNALSLMGVHSYEQTILVTVPACLVVSLTLGWGFHVVVERKFLNPPRTPISVPALPSGEAVA